MRRPTPSRWAVALALSVLAHLGAFVGAGARLSSDVELPQLVVQAVVGVPVPEEETRSPPPDPPTEPASPPDARRTPSEQAEPPPPEPRPSGATVVDPEGDLPRAPAPAASPAPAEAPTDGGPATADGSVGEADGGPPALALPEAAAEGDLATLMAGEARVALLVRTDRLASSPHALQLRRTIRHVPGFEEYFGASGFDPLTDFSWFSLRTPDPSVVPLSAVTARLSIDAARARATVERLLASSPGEAVDWRAIPDAGVPMARAAGRDADHRGELGWSVAGDEPLLLAGPATWVAHAAANPDEALAQAQEGLAEVSLDGEAPALILAAEGLDVVVGASGATWPAPRSVVLAASFDDDGMVVADLFFEDDDAAGRFARGVAATLRSWAGQPLARVVDLAGLLGGLRIEQRGDVVRASSRLSPSEVRRALALTRLLLVTPESEDVEALTNIDGARTEP